MNSVFFVSYFELYGPPDTCTLDKEASSCTFNANNQSYPFDTCTFNANN